MFTWLDIKRMDLFMWCLIHRKRLNECLVAVEISSIQEIARLAKGKNYYSFIYYKGKTHETGTGSPSSAVSWK